jgi:hypothetical protein
MPRTWRLRIALDIDWPGIMAECANAIQAVFKRNRVLVYRPDKQSRCAVAVVYSNSAAYHGPGAKHLRPIELTKWQAEIVDEQSARCSHLRAIDLESSGGR